MKSITFSMVAILVFYLQCSNGGESMNRKFRKAVFLHHSTGTHIFGPNGSTVSVPDEIKKYNKRNNFPSELFVSMDEMAWPTTEMIWNNEWYRWNDIFQNKDVYKWGFKKLIPDFNSSNRMWKRFLKKYPIIIIKSCFPSSQMVSESSSQDTSDLKIKTIENYKTIWLKMMRYFRTYPNNFFVIWTNAPLARGATTAESARLSKAFCKWAKDTLATGKDAVLPDFPSNVYIFDFFDLMTGEDGIALDSMVQSAADSHPNSTATETIAPVFVEEVFNAAIAYEEKQKK